MRRTAFAVGCIINHQISVTTLLKIIIEKTDGRAPKVEYCFNIGGGEDSA
jgi:hypothetical protein